jgi:hypothetical protein
MMPCPVLEDNFHLTYRKIHVLAIGHEVFQSSCSTLWLSNAQSFSVGLLRYFPDHRSPGAHLLERPSSIYPPVADGTTNRSLIRGFASYWTDVGRCLFPHSPFPKFTRMETLVPRNDRPHLVQRMAYALRHRSYGTHRPPAQARGQNPPKPVRLEYASGMES